MSPACKYQEDPFDVMQGWRCHIRAFPKETMVSSKVTLAEKKSRLRNGLLQEAEMIGRVDAIGRTRMALEYWKMA